MILNCGVLSSVRFPALREMPEGGISRRITRQKTQTIVQFIQILSDKIVIHTAGKVLLCLVEANPS